MMPVPRQQLFRELKIAAMREIDSGKGPTARHSHEHEPIGNAVRQCPGGEFR